MFGKLMSVSDDLMARYYDIAPRTHIRQRRASARSQEATRVRNRADLSLDCVAQKTLDEWNTAI